MNGKQLLTDEQILSKSCDMQRSGDPEPYMEAWEVEDWVMEARDIYEKELQKKDERIKELEGVLEFLQRKGGLGLGIHEVIKQALKKWKQ